MLVPTNEQVRIGLLKLIKEVILAELGRIQVQVGQLCAVLNELLHAKLSNLLALVHLNVL